MVPVGLTGRALALAATDVARTTLRSASWGLKQIIGFNHKAAGYANAGDMMAAFCDAEALHLEAMVAFIASEGLDDDLRRHDWSGFARGYNGAGYAQHGYQTRLAAAFKRWQAIPDVLAPTLPKIGLGARGPAVKTAQQRLLAAGHDPRAVDGWFGDNTRHATIAFQSAHGLVPDGIIGPKTWASLTPHVDTV
ncbi:N-acetylmuramidase domain-containing protein [Falsirhodobacter halotolerans]|uniref:N-acetylmuramidase domain-containing protein n=1 Tax=Falsirhodobacter halotolerans TaxID=1146892 RepID=UPI001FD43ECF|nr:N-acetylmuramidase domain-containing protein [Falsirhodobacter halotolerans]MCJ8139409.1 N-acetylmuramidase domain-containing protein [Falsirhodobacter halotolerans]